MSKHPRCLRQVRVGNPALSQLPGALARCRRQRHVSRARGTRPRLTGHCCRHRALAQPLLCPHGTSREPRHRAASSQL